MSCIHVATGCVLPCCNLLQLDAIIHALNLIYFVQSLSQVHQALLAAPCVTSYADCVWVRLGLHAACSCPRSSRAALSFDGCLFEHIGVHTALAQQLNLAQ